MTRYPALLLVGVLASGCVTKTYQTLEVTRLPVQQENLLPARNLPQVFTVLTPARVPGDCPPRLSDPSLGTTLMLEQSVMMPMADSAGVAYRALGNYSVRPAGRYGEGEGEGLQVDCRRLAALGVISLRGEPTAPSTLAAAGRSP